MAGRTPTDWESKGVAIAGYSAAVICKLSPMHPQSYRPHTDRHESGCHQQQTFPAILGRRWIRESRYTCLVSSLVFFAKGTFAHPKQH
jgi:hypothetical protein